MQNKRGQGLSTTAIVLIVLGVVLLVVLIIGFAMGWENIAPWLSGDNVDTIVNQCGAACSTNSMYDYCSKMRKLKAEKIEIETNCATFSVISEYDKYGIEECSALSCDIPCVTIKVGSKTAVEKEVCEATEDDVTSIADVKCCILKG